MAKIGVRPSIREFAQHRSMSGRANVRPPVSQGSSETLIAESNKSSSMCPICLFISANFRGDVSALLAMPIDTTQETNLEEQDDTTLFYTRHPHLGDVVPHPSSYRHRVLILDAAQEQSFSDDPDWNRLI